MLSIGKLFQKFKLWPIEKCEFVFQQNDNDNCVFFVLSAIHQKNSACAKSEEIQMKDLSTDRKLSNE